MLPIASTTQRQNEKKVGFFFHDFPLIITGFCAWQALPVGQRRSEKVMFCRLFNKRVHLKRFSTKLGLFTGEANDNLTITLHG